MGETPYPEDCLAYNTKPSDSKSWSFEEYLFIRATLLPGPLWLGLEVSFRALLMDQVEIVSWVRH